MNHLRIIKTNNFKKVEQKKKKIVASRIDEHIVNFKIEFFDHSVGKLLQKIHKFFEKNDTFPFPVVAHVLPSQETDGEPFLFDLHEQGYEVFQSIERLLEKPFIFISSQMLPTDIPSNSVFRLF
jgi:uncharacterized protein YtpQ (UPF0354 family)